MKLRTTSDEIAESTFDGKTRKFRRVVALGVAPGDFSEQFVEIQLPEAHPPVGIGIEIEFRLKSVSSLFQGKARVQGTIVEPPKK